MSADAPSFWPCVGDYLVYDELLYHVMTTDALRNDAYRRALAEAAPTRTVLDLGTGADAVLALLAADVGARHVYAIERDANAAEAARRTVRESGLMDRVTVIEGEIGAVELPEPAEVCVWEIIGSIASSEGATPILAAAERYLTPTAIFIPPAVETKIAAVTLPSELSLQPRLPRLARHYVDQVFAEQARRFDLRLCIPNFPAEALLSDAETLEAVRPAHVPASGREVCLEVTRAGVMHGFLLWVVVDLDVVTLDALSQSLPSWPPAFWPVFYPGVHVDAGSTIRFTLACDYRSPCPDYRLEGTAVSHNGRMRFSFESPHAADTFRGSPFYRALWAS